MRAILLTILTALLFGCSGIPITESPAFEGVTAGTVLDAEGKARLDASASGQWGEYLATVSFYYDDLENSWGFCLNFDDGSGLVISHCPQFDIVDSQLTPADEQLEESDESGTGDEGQSDDGSSPDTSPPSGAMHVEEGEE